MGCGLSHKVVQDTSKKAALVPKGLLTVRVVQASLTRDTSMVSTMDPYVKMRLTTQSYRTKTIKSGGKAPAFNEDFAFYVNSDSIAEGRILEIAVMDQNSTFNPQIGYGIVDCDPIIMNKLANISQKCYIVHNGKSAGYVNLQFSFREELLGILFIHILNASIRRKTSTISDMQCRARLTIGEEITATEKSRDTKNEAPHWNEVFRIPIIRSNETGIIEIIDIGVNSETLVGDCEINVKELVEPTGEGYHQTYIWYKQVEAGSVKYITSFVSLEGIEPEKRQEYIDQKWNRLAQREKEILSKTNYNRSKLSRANSRVQQPFDNKHEEVSQVEHQHQPLPNVKDQRVESKIPGGPQGQSGEVPKEHSHIESNILKPTPAPFDFSQDKAEPKIHDVKSDSVQTEVHPPQQSSQQP